MIAARLFFVIMPALLTAACFVPIHPLLGGLVFGCVFGLGWQVTRAHPERGES